MAESPRLLPQPTIDTQPYWDGLKEGHLRLQRCARCSKVRHYPRPVCDACYSMNSEWFDAAGRGRIHSWTITHHAFHPAFKEALPLVLVTVDLEEGARMNAPLRQLDAGELRVGLPVRVGFERITPEVTLPVIQPA
jgi:uncharacterized OB-fold protein